MTNFQQFINKGNYRELQAVYEVDQAQEAAIKGAGARGRWNSTPQNGDGCPTMLLELRSYAAFKR